MVSPEYRRVTVKPAVVHVDKTEQTGSPVLKKQYILISNSTGSIQLTLWEKGTGSILKI